MSVELERFDPAEQGGRIAYEHLHRYALCREFVTGRRVLDLACGTGYGTAILATAAAEVVGVDISDAAIRQARKRYPGDNLTFVTSDCLDLPFDTGSFDIVVANEMIEHIEDHARLLAEVRRVLADKGMLLVSTPNKPVYNRYKAPNIYHVSEMDVPEFRKLLTDRFRHVRMTGARMALLSVGYSIDQSEPREQRNLNAARVHLVTNASGGQPLLEAKELQLADPEYVLAVCSDAPIENPDLASSIFFDERYDLWLEHEKVMAWASNLHEEDEVLRADLVRSNNLLEEARSRVAQTEAERAEIADRYRQLEVLQASLTAALETEREALTRETETLRREAAGRLSMLSELLGRMGSQSVAPDDTAIVSGLFQINEVLVTERLQRAHADARNAELAARIAALQNEAAEVAAEKTRLVAQLATRTEELASERRNREQSEVARQALADEARAIAEQLAAARSAAAEESERLTAAFADREAGLQAQIEAAREAHAGEVRAIAEQLAAERRQREQLAAAQEALAEEVRTAARQLAATRSAAAEERERLTAALAERDKEREAARPIAALAPSEASASSAAPDRAGEASAALNQLHSRTSALLASVSARGVGQIAPPPERAPLPWYQRALGKKRVLDTAIFSNVWLARQDPGLSELSLRAFLADPQYNALSPHPLFDAAYYLHKHPDVAQSGMSPLVHYVLHGWREGRDPHPLFLNDWYLAQNPDVAAHGALDPLDHYLLHGWREGRQPNPLFNPRSYLSRYPDVQAANFEPLSHFMLYGESEGRVLAIDGWSKALPDVATQGGVLRVMERLLREPPPAVSPAQAGPQASATDDGDRSAPWPPAPVDNFWPAQTMREMIAEMYGEPLLGRIWYLLSLMARWQDRQDEFAASDDCRTLLGRLRERANAAARAASPVPSATVIIPVYNNVLDTLLCLASLLELDERHDFEVIVADDGSTDATTQLIPTIGGNVRLLRQPKNLGFLGNCNAAAAQARGKAIVLLNNDTLVFSGWLDGLLDPIETMPDIGLVGSKLINWDGTLQEAGGIFWHDGSAWNFGRNQDARAPEFNYLKDIDYCSGASIAIPTQIWQEVGGFDPTYSPAYCEDSDLAFRLREAGYRTLYSPSSEVVHHEGRSHGRDVASGIKAYQVVNQQRLLDRWRPVLERDHYPNAENVLRARDRSFAKRHVLVVDHYVPQWDQDAGSRTMFDFLQVLVQAGHAVTFWPDNLWRDPDYTPRLQALGVEVIFGPRYVNGFEQFLLDRKGLYDMVLLSRPHISVNYIDKVRRLTSASVVYYGHDVHFRRMMAERELAGQPVEDANVLAMKAQELGICNASDMVLYPSEDEARLMRGLVKPGVQVFSITAYRYLEEELAAARQTILTRSDEREPVHLLFVGGFAHTPNVDAVLWFCRSVMPLLRSGAKVRVSIAGSRPPAEVLDLQAADVDVLGFVSDERLQNLYREAHIAVAPLRFGAGVKGKVIEAMARGCPVVTTDVGAQGIDGAADLMFIGNTAEALAAEVLRAAEPETGRTRALAAIDFIEEHYSTRAMTGVLERGFAHDRVSN